MIRGEHLGSDDRDVDQLLIKKKIKKEDTQSVCQSYRQTLRLVLAKQEVEIHAKSLLSLSIWRDVIQFGAYL